MNESSPQEHYDAFAGYDDDDFAEESSEQHVVSAYKYFRRQHSDYLMAVGSHGYIVKEPKGDKFQFRKRGSVQRNADPD